MKVTKNLPIYLLSASLVFVGASSVANGATSTVTTAQFTALQKRVKALEEKLQAGYNEQEITYVAVNRISPPQCPQGYAVALDLLSSNLYRYALCTSTVLVP